MNLLHRLVYSNLWVALAAPSVLYTHAAIGDLEFPPEMYVFVFSAVLFTYNIQRLYRADTYLSPDLLARHGWIVKNHRFLWIITLSAIIPMLYSIPRIPSGFLLLIIPAGLLSALYFLPLPCFGKRLRDVPLIKIPLVAFTWAWVLLIAPSGEYVEKNLPLFLFEFLLFFAVTLPFDLRDKVHDQKSGTVTWAIRLGTKKTKWIALIFVFLSLIPLCVFYSTNALTPLLLSAGLTGIILAGVNEERNDLYYGFLLDGSLVMQGPLVWLWINLF
jgi:4-hydroxybenzoate polyprenyltransferase